MYIVSILLMVVIFASLVMAMALWLDVNWQIPAGGLLVMPIILMVILGLGYGAALVLSALMAMLAMAAFRWQFMLELWQQWQAMPGNWQARIGRLVNLVLKTYQAPLYLVAKKIMPSKVSIAGGRHVLIERLIAAVNSEDFNRATAIVSRLGVGGRQTFLQAVADDKLVSLEKLLAWSQHSPQQSIIAISLCYVLGEQWLADVTDTDTKHLLNRYQKRLSTYQLHPYEAAMLTLAICPNKTKYVMAAFQQVHKVAPFNLPAMLLVLKRLHVLGDEVTAKKLIQQHLKQAKKAPQVYLLPVVWQLHQDQLQLGVVDKCWLALQTEMPQSHKTMIVNYFASAYWLLNKPVACGELIKAIDENYHAPAWQFGRQGLAVLGPEYAISACLKSLNPKTKPKLALKQKPTRSKRSAKAKPAAMKKSAQPAHG